LSSGKFAGVGFVVSADDPFTVVDIDVHEGEELTPLQREILERLDTYIEHSPSGRGFHLWAFGNIGKGKRRDNVEVYSQKRFVTFTGNFCGEAKPITDQQKNLSGLVDHLSQGKSQAEACDIELTYCAPNKAVAASFAERQNSMGAAWNNEQQDRSAAVHALCRPLREKCDSDSEALATFLLSPLAQSYGEKEAQRKFSISLEAQASETAEVEFIRYARVRGAELADGIRWRWDAVLRGAPDPGATRAPVVHTVANDVGKGARRLIGRSLGDVQMQAIEWLWTGWIPKGYITLLAGETGAGKSTVLADMTARVTTGTPWPGEDQRRTPARVLWLGSEDGIEDMTIPRITACGGNLYDVIEIQGTVEKGKRSTFSMQDDIESVGDWLEHAENEGNPFAMLVIDPITSYLPGQKLRKVDMSDTGQLRMILEPWFSVAQKYGIAIVCVTHFTKDTQRSMLHRVLGSQTFAAVCRSLVAIINQPDDGQFAKAMVQVKTNLPEHPGGAWRFSTEKTQVGNDKRNGKPITATRPCWERLDNTLTPESVTGNQPGGVIGSACAALGIWLKQYFEIKGGLFQWLPSSEVMSAALDANACSKKTWSEHSGKLLDKQNDNGTWRCRLKNAP
jgi:hypothetical protein